MLKTVQEAVIKPQLTRLGNLVAGLLIGHLGANPTLAQSVGVGIAALGLIGIDWVLANWRRVAIERKWFGMGQQSVIDSMKVDV